MTTRDVAALSCVAEELAGELLARPLLERILRRCTELLDCDAGSISSVDEAAGTYRKEAEIGIKCHTGRVFPLTEGMTGEVVRRRGPVWFDRYADVAGGHLSEADGAWSLGVIGAPIEWRGRIIGACVVFGERFTAEDAELLRVFARHAAVPLVNANSHEAAEERARLQAADAERERLLIEVQGLLDKGLVDLNAALDQAERYAPDVVTEHLRRARAEAENTMTEVRRSLGAATHSPLEDRTLEEALREELAWAERARGADARLVIAGAPVPLDLALAEHVLSVAQEALSNIVRHSGASTIRLGLVYNSATLALLVQDDGRGFALDPDDPGLGLPRIAELASSVGGSATVESVPGWGTSVRAGFPYQRTTGTDPQRVDVVVLAARPLTRAGLSRLLTWSGETLAVVGEASGVDALGSIRPQVVVVGPDLSRQAGLIGQITAAPGGPAVVAMCAAGDHHAAAEALLAGAHGCVETTADGPTLARAVVAASRGESLVPDTGVWAGRLTSEANPAELTPREMEVYALVCQGLSDKMIAARLTIAVKTVEKHVGAVLRKTGSRARGELIARGR